MGGGDRLISKQNLGPIFREIEGLDDDTILMLFVIYERFNNANSFWKPYFDVLPDIFPTALNFGYVSLRFFTFCSM